MAAKRVKEHVPPGKTRRRLASQPSLRLDASKLPIGYVSLDKDGLVLDANPKWYEILAYSRDEVLGHWFGDFVAPESQATFQERFTELPNQDEVVNVELSMVRRDGRSVRVLFSGTVEHAPPGQIKQIHTLLHGVPGDLSPQQLIGQGEARSRAIFDHMSSCVAVYEARSDGEDFVFVDFNQAAERADEMRRQDIIGKSVLNVFPGIKEFGLFEVFQRVWRTGDPERYPLAEYCDERICGWRENYVYKLPSGEIVALYEDVTERMDAERRLQSAKTYLAEIINAIGDPVFVKNEYSRFTLANNALCTMLGKGRDELIGRTGGEFLPPDQQGHFLEVDRMVLSSGKENLCEELLTDGSGEIRTIITRKTRHVDADGARYIVGVIRDITEQKLVGIALQESELKYRQVVDNASQAIFVTRGEQIVFLNPMASTLTGYTRDEVMSRKFSEFIYPDDCDMVLEWHRARSKGDEVSSPYAFRIARADGAVRWVELNAVVIDWESQPATLNFLTEITERKQADAERESLLERQIVINRITLSLGAAADLNSILRTFYSEVRTLVDADGFFVSRYHKDTGLITAMFIIDRGVEHDVARFPPIPLASEGKGMQSQVVRTNQPLSVPNWIERERMMQTVYHTESHGMFTAPPPEDERGECTQSALLVPMMLQGEIVGVLQVQSNRLNAYSEGDVELLKGLANVAAISIRDAQLVEQARLSLEGTIAALAQTTEMRDPYTAGHQRRVSQLAREIAEKMGLAENAVESLRVAGLLHDIGKVSTPAEILSKPGVLTPNEFCLVKEHVRIGFDILKGIAFPWPVADVVLQHHERLDGSGYPRGLKSEAILLEARILGVADVVEAMSSHRPYRPALKADAAMREIEEHRGKLYDSDVVETCAQLFADGFEFEPAGQADSP